MTLNQRFFLFLIFSVIQLPIFGQASLNDIDLERIPQKKVRNFISLLIEDGKSNFEDIKPSWEKGNDLSNYEKDERIYLLEEKIDRVWDVYTSVDPSKAWESRKVSLGLVLSKNTNEIFYTEDSINGIQLKQVYFLNLKILGGLSNIPVSFEIITINAEDRLVEFSYIEGNQSQGFQQIKFEEDAKQNVKIIHTSYFKSKSKFRDKYLYPYFHKKMLNDFHANIKELIVD